MNSGWHTLGLVSLSSALVFGMMGRKRIYFTDHQTYNKYHFGVLCQLLSSGGLMLTRKTKQPAHAGAFFIAGMVLNSCVAYYEGYIDAYEKPPPEWDTATTRLTGFYSIL